MDKHWFIMPPHVQENNSDRYWVISRGVWVLYLSNRIDDFRAREVNTIEEAEALAAELSIEFAQIKEGILREMSENRCSSQG